MLPKKMFAAANKAAPKATKLDTKLEVNDNVAAEDFVNKASTNYRFEVEAGKMAIEKSIHMEVRQFARQLVNDNSKYNEKLRAVVPTAGVSENAIPQMLDPEHQAILQVLKNAPREDFDRQYLKAQAEAQKKSAALFNYYAVNGGNAGLRSFCLSQIEQNVA